MSWKLDSWQPIPSMASTEAEDRRPFQLYYPDILHNQCTSVTKTGCLCSGPFASWLSAHSTNWDASSIRAHSVNKRSLQTRSLLCFVRPITLLGKKKKKRKRFKVVNPILLTSGYLHPIIPLASRDILFNDLMQSSLSFKFDFQSLHFKWGKEETVCQSESHWKCPFSSFPLHASEMERVSKALSHA